MRATLLAPARAAARSKGTYLAAQYSRLAGRRGANRAALAVAHTILVITYHILDRHEPYHELGAEFLLHRHNTDAHTRRLVRQLETLAHKLTLEPTEPAA